MKILVLQRILNILGFGSFLHHQLNFLSFFYLFFIIYFLNSIQFSLFIFPYLFILYFILCKLCLRKFLLLYTLVLLVVFEIKIKFSIHTEFVSFVNLIVELCYFVDDFSSTHHPHTHNFTPKIPACL